MKSKLFAAIDIGSHKLRMKIVQAGENGEIRVLETVDKLIPLGRDTFNDEKLSFESVQKTCEAIQGFKRLMTDYGVREWRIVATSAIREAANRDYMLDRIRLLTGFDVEIINNSQEKFLAYKAIKWQLRNHPAINTDEPTLILNVGGGSIQLLMSENNLLVSSQSLKIGALRIKESISKVEKHTLHFSKVLEEYVEAHIENVEFLKSSNEIAHYVLVSPEFENMMRLSSTGGGTVVTIPRTLFEERYARIVTKSTTAISEEMDISYGDAELFVPSMILIRKFFDKTGSDTIVIPNVSLVDGMIVEHFNRPGLGSRYIDFNEDILSCARKLAERYRYIKPHSQYVENACMIMFDKLSRVHGLGESQRFMLRVGALLHDIGKYIGADPHYLYSYNIINASQIIGLSDDELRIVACIARYHSLESPKLESPGLVKLSTENRIIAMKLIAIIRLSDALDRSHKQKLRIRSMTVKEGSFVVSAECSEEVVLERWTFYMKADLFTEVFGIKPEINIQNVLL